MLWKVCFRKIMIFNMCFIHRRYDKMPCLIISNLQHRTDRNHAKMFPNNFLREKVWLNFVCQSPVSLTLVLICLLL